jgi:predicted CoA-substrate-specific enzyme activase
MTLCGGVDVGASATKLVLVDERGEVHGRAVRPSGVDYQATASAALVEALAQAGLPPDAPLVDSVATGYGRHNVGFAQRTQTEIQCHATGCYHHFQRAITIVDIGGQDNKVIHLDASGRRADFRMNRKCAAGTGAFVEEIALRLAIPLADIERLAASSDQTVRLSSFCTVFAKTEILSHLRAGVPVAALARGVLAAVVQRVVEMDPLAGEVVLTGGVVAHNPTIARLLAEKLGREVLVAPHPQFAGALGAALLALAGSQAHHAGDRASDRANADASDRASDEASDERQRQGR